MAKMMSRAQVLTGIRQMGMQEFEVPELTLCPKCQQPISEQYKTELIRSIQKVLSEEVENHQNTG